MKKCYGLRVFILLMLFISTTVFVKALTITDSTFYNGTNTIPVYNIKWTDNLGNPRQALMTKSYASDNYPGICVWLQYYNGTVPVTIKSTTPNAPGVENRGFGATVHHYDVSNTIYSWVSQGTNQNLSLRLQGAHIAIFDLVQNINASTEYVTYTFMDGLDYFQWQQTVQCGSSPDTTFDSRGPYCTMDWDGNGLFDVLQGQQYEARAYFSQPSYNGAWTLDSTKAKGIPYVNEWLNSKEVGYVQSQTYSQQLSGTPLNETYIPGWNGYSASGSNMPANGSPTFFMDYQMNFYEQLQKMTWGMPYGYMEGQSGSGTKNGWGQYSLSIMFDAQSAGGVLRLQNENLAIHGGKVIVTASQGSVVTTGPIGTKNPSLQTLSPAGYDHNYRAWWLQSNISQQSQITMNVTSGSLLNPTFRIKGMNQAPAMVVYNGTTLTSNTDYFASYDATNSEAWVTLVKNVSGSNTILFQGSANIVISSLSVSPSSLSNYSSTILNFSVSASSTGGIVNSVKLNLSSIGGGSAVSMTLSSGNTYTCSYTLPAGQAIGSKSIPVTVTDNLSNTQTSAISLTITSGTVISSATVTPSSVYNNVSNVLAFAVTATDDGSVTSVALNLSPIGGGSSIMMTSLGGNNYSSSYTMAAGASSGLKEIPVSVTDNQGNISMDTILLNVANSTSYLSIYTDTSTMICSTCTWGSNGTIVEQTGQGAIEGVKDYAFNYTVASGYAGLGLNVSNWGANPKSFTGYDSLDLAYKGPITTGTAITVTLVDATGTYSTAVSLPASTVYTKARIALSAFGTTINLSKITEIDIAVTGALSGTGLLRLDDIVLSKQNVVATAAITASGATTFCQGGSVTLTASTGTSYIWKNGTAQVGTSQTYVASASGSYTVQVTSEAGTATSAATVVTVNALPAAPTVTTPVTYCQNATATSLTATGNSLLWYTVATGGTGMATAPTPVTTATGTTNYYVSQTVTGCEGPRAMIAVTINALPSAPAVTTPVTYCQNATATALTATGTALKWYTVTTGGTSSATAPTPVTTATGTTNYYVSQTVTGCEGPRAMIAVTINALPSAPAVTTPVTYCQNATATALTATGTALKWYTVTTGGTSSATAPTPVTTATGTTNYYVSQTVTGCEGPRAMIAVTINALSSAPAVTTPVTYCQNATATALTATGTALKWYTVATGGTSSTTAPTPITTATGTTNYYVSQTVTGCEGPRATIAVTINTTPSAPGVTSPVAYCQNATTSPLTATGINLLWYATVTGGTGSTSAPVPSTATTGSTNYYVSQTSGTCESQRSLITVTVNVAPSAPIVTNPAAYCQNYTATALTATGTNLNWYSVSTGGTGSATAPTPNTATLGTTNYYVSQTSNGCESPRAMISVTVNVTPLVPVVTSPVTYCQNATVTVLSAIGTNLNWYSVSTGGAGSATAPTPNTATVGTTNYYVSQTSNGCESPRAAISVIVNALPLPVISSGSNMPMCTGSSTVLSTATASTYNWMNGTSQVGTSQTYTATIAGNYTVTVTNGSGCSGTSAALVVSISSQNCYDCANVLNGTAVIDNCGVCTGGTTGLIACTTTGIIGGTLTTSSIVVYPQPFENTTRVELKNGGNIESITIYSSTGSVVYSKSDVASVAIEVGENLADGLYTVVVSTQEGIYTTKILKVK